MQRDGANAAVRAGTSPKARRRGRHHRGMSVATSPLAHAYHPRLGTFVADERLGDWRLKLYGLAAPEKGVRPALVERTRELAAASLPPVDEDHHGAAFAIAHDARFPIALIYWWQDVNELHARIYAGRRDRRARARAGDGAVVRLGARHRRVRAPRLDRGRDRQPGRPRPRALPSRRFDGMI